MCSLTIECVLLLPRGGDRKGLPRQQNRARATPLSVQSSSTPAHRGAPLVGLERVLLLQNVFSSYRMWRSLRVRLHTGARLSLAQNVLSYYTVYYTL